MKRKSFTLIEILVALIILSILVSLSVAAYQKTVDTNNERICAQNLKVLQAAIDIYTVENDDLPLTLAQLTPRQIYLAYSRVIGENKENFLNIAFRKMFSTKQALAAPPGLNKYLKTMKVLCDPKVDNCSPPGTCDLPFGAITTCGSSYRFRFDNNTFDTTTRRLRNDSLVFLVSDSSPRHGRTPSPTYALGITPGGRVFRDKDNNGYGDATEECDD